MKRKATATKSHKAPPKPKPATEPVSAWADPEPVETTSVQPESGGQRIERERLERVAREIQERGSAL